MKKYEVVKEVFNPCGGDKLPDNREIMELMLKDPSDYVQRQYMQERSVEFLALEREDGSPVIEALLEGGRKHRYTFSEL